MKNFLTAILFLSAIIGNAQDIIFGSEYNKIAWPLGLGVSGGIVGDDGQYKRLALYHGNSISLQVGSNSPGITNSKLFVAAWGVGINNIYPTQSLHVTGIIRGVGSSTGLGYGELNLDGGTEFQGFQVRKQNEWGLSPYWAMKATENFPIAIFTGNDAHNGIYIAATTGNVGIKTSVPDAPLTVNGVIHSEEVRVTTGIEWADYVFDEDYKLPSLDQVKSYIKQNHHLPEVPSAAEVTENGIMLGEMNTVLLKKIEELTLYMIDLKEDNTRLTKDVEALKAELRKK